MKYNLYRSSMLYFTIAFLSFFITFQSEAQSIKRQSIASNGASALIDGVSIRQTIGQSYFTSGYYDDEAGLRPGFQQPSNFRLESMSSANIKLNVYPNPAVFTVNIESREVISNALIQVTDMNGKLFWSKKIPELKTYLINCDTWQNGFYFITVYNEQKNYYSAKLIISK